MLNWLANVIDLCFYRRGPADMPAAPSPLLVAAGAYSAFTFYALKPILAPQSALVPAALQVLIPIAVTVVALNLTGRQARILQTLIALFSTGVVFTLAGRLAALFLPELSLNQIDANHTPPPAALWIIFCLGIWSFLVDARIYQMALERGYGIGIATALAVSFFQFAALTPWLAAR